MLKRLVPIFLVHLFEHVLFSQSLLVNAHELIDILCTFVHVLKLFTQLTVLIIPIVS